MIPEGQTRGIGSMRFFTWCAAVAALGLAACFLSGCGETRSEVGTSQELRKADLASQDAMRDDMKTQTKESKPRGRRGARP
jgi:hypothetical protein